MHCCKVKVERRGRGREEKEEENKPLYRLLATLLAAKHGVSKQASDQTKGRIAGEATPQKR